MAVPRGVSRRPSRGPSAKPTKAKVTSALRFEKDIRPLFDKRAVEHMKTIAGFDLSRFEDVRRHAGRIYFRLSTKTMPPDKPWPDNQIAKFKKWMDGGMKS
jgi:hypothetical protein